MKEAGKVRRSQSPPGAKDRQRGSGLTDGDRKVLAKFFSFGAEFAGVLSIFSFFGYQTDQYFGTMPWFTLTAIVIAIIGLVYQLVKDLGNLN